VITDVTRLIRPLIGLVAIATLVVACSPPPEPLVSDVSIDQGDQTIEVGDTVQLSVTVGASGGASQAVTWSSDNTAAATVSDGGLVTGVAQGTAVITATSVANPNRSDSITVTVTSAGTVTAVEIVGGDRQLALWETDNLDVVVTSPDGASDAVTWTSSNDSVVSVSPDGTIQAVGADASATITATSVVTPSVSDSILVTVSAIPDPDLDNVYVDASVPPGGNGHVDYPFQTISLGIAAVNGGGTVNVLPGTYDEALRIEKSLSLLGAGPTQVTIRANQVAPGPDSEAAIFVVQVDGLTLQGFRLEADLPVTGFSAAIGLRNIFPNPGSSNVLVQDVEIHHTSTNRTSRGVAIREGSAIVLQDVAINAIPDPGDTTGGETGHAGAGVSIQGNSADIVLDGVTTSGHEAFAGVVLDPILPVLGPDAITDVTITQASDFSEINKMTVDLTLGGTVSGLDAPAFVASVANLSDVGVYGQGERFFYKTSVNRAVLDSLFNFNERDSSNTPAWIRSVVQTLDATDQAIRNNEFVIGSVFDTEYGFGITRSHFIQAAVDAALPGASLLIEEGTFAGADESVFGGAVEPGNVVIDVSNLTIVGSGGSSIIAADEGSVLTIEADGVSISDVEIGQTSVSTGATAIVVGAGVAGLSVTESNLVADVALDNSVGVAVTATNNWWGAANGPGGPDGPGDGSGLIDPAAAVDFTGFTAQPFD
jgi:hypothetical protein